MFEEKEMSKVVINFLLNGIEENASDIARVAKNTTRCLKRVNKRVTILSLLVLSGMYCAHKDNEKLRKRVKALEDNQYRYELEKSIKEPEVPNLD